MDRYESQSPSARPPTILEEGRQRSDPQSLQLNDVAANSDAGASSHIRLEAPKRPDLLKRNTLRGQSSKSVSEALRLERSREEQETLLGADEEADDDGCYPPRISDEPRAPNPHKSLPVYATIHKIRRLVIACIGRQRRARLAIGVVG
jgi:hypothetical protein